MTSDLYIIAIYVIIIIFGILIWFFMNISINDLSYPRLLKAGSLIIFALYPVIIKKTYEHFPDEIAEHLNIVIFFLAFWTLVFAEIKEASIFNADRETALNIEDTVGATQRTVNLIEDTVDETQETVSSVKTTADVTQRTVNSVEAMAGATQETINSVEAMADATQKTVNSVKTKMEDIDQQFSDLDDKIDNLPSKLTIESQDSSSQEAVNSVKTKMEDIDQQFSDLDDKIDNLPSKLTIESQEIGLPSKSYITLFLIACSVFISIVIGVSMFYTEQVFSSKTNSILQENSNNMADILNQVSGLDTTITKIDSLQKNMQEQIQEQIQMQMQEQIQNLSRKIDSLQSTPTPSNQDSSSTGSGDSP